MICGSLFTFDAHLPVSKYQSCYYFILHGKRKSVLSLIPSLLKPLSFDPEAWLCKISIKTSSFCYLFFLFLRRDRRNAFPFFASFGSDQQQVPSGSPGDIWGLWSLPAACFCPSLSLPLVILVKNKSHIGNIWSRLIIICGYRFPFACLHAMSHRDSKCQSRLKRDWTV